AESDERSRRKVVGERVLATGTNGLGLRGARREYRVFGAGVRAWVARVRHGRLMEGSRIEVAAGVSRRFRRRRRFFPCCLRRRLPRLGGGLIARLRQGGGRL